MKRIVIMVLVLMMFSFPALSQELDLSTMNLDELLALKNQIDGEVISRIGPSNSYIYDGEYLVGKNIEAGEYVFICTDVKSSVTDMTLYLYAVNGMDKGERLVWENLRVGDQFSIKLNDGQFLIIENGSGALNPYNPTWAP